MAIMRVSQASAKTPHDSSPRDFTTCNKTGNEIYVTERPTCIIACVTMYLHFVAVRATTCNNYQQLFKS